jgi:hypothetical protein
MKLSPIETAAVGSPVAAEDGETATPNIMNVTTTATRREPIEKVWQQ